jgi:hypothetical protein
MEGTMTPRERVLTALDHRRSDRTPRDFWAEPPAWRRLLAHLGPAHLFQPDVPPENILAVYDA